MSRTPQEPVPSHPEMYPHGRCPVCGCGVNWAAQCMNEDCQEYVPGADEEDTENDTGPMNCPTCGGVIQATQELWLTIEPDGTVSQQEGELRLYCENDHQLDNDTDVCLFVSAALRKGTRRS